MKKIYEICNDKIKNIIDDIELQNYLVLHIYPYENVDEKNYGTFRTVLSTLVLKL